MPKSKYKDDVQRGYEVLNLTFKQIAEQLEEIHGHIVHLQTVQRVVKQFNFKRKPKKIRQIR